jgi:hypothetical protein
VVLEVGGWTRNDPTPKKFTVTKPHGGGQDPYRAVAPVKKKKKKKKRTQ